MEKAPPGRGSGWGLRSRSGHVWRVSPLIALAIQLLGAVRPSEVVPTAPSCSVLLSFDFQPMFGWFATSSLSQIGSFALVDSDSPFCLKVSIRLPPFGPSLESELVYLLEVDPP
jgi:hypothetical protein